MKEGAPSPRGRWRGKTRRHWAEVAAQERTNSRSQDHPGHFFVIELTTAAFFEMRTF
jgi:hypothetical protein